LICRQSLIFGLLLLSVVVSVLLPGEVRAETSDLKLELTYQQARDLFSCSEDYLRTVELSFQGETYFFELPHLYTTPIIHPLLSCSRFLEEWIEHHFAKLDKEQRLSLVFSPPRPSLYLRDLKHSSILSSPDMRSDCLSFGFCHQATSDFANIREDLRACHPQSDLSSFISRMIPRVLRPRVTPIPEVRIRIFPKDHFTEELWRPDIYDKSTSLFGSTMTLGRGTLRAIAQRSSQSDRSVFLAPDASLITQAGSVGSMFEVVSRRPNLHILPITSGGYFRTIHHWKIILGDSGVHSALSGMNMVSTQSVAYADFIYQFSDPKVTQELRDNLLWALGAQCRRKNDFECLLKFAGNDSSTIADVQQGFDLACSKLRKSSSLPWLEPRNRYFMQPQNTDLSFYVRQLISEAKEEVVILSHKFSLQEIYLALLEAQKRGVKVYVYLTHAPRIEQAQTPEIQNMFFHPGDAVSRRASFDPHMKVLLVDRKTLFFGTGGFTRNAFFDARELYATTHDLAAIQEVLKFAEVLRFRYQQGEIEPFFNEAVERSWVVFGENPDTEARDPKIQQLTNFPSEPWMRRRYRELGKSAMQGLKECKMGQLLFVSYQDFVGCLSRLENGNDEFDVVNSDTGEPQNQSPF